jgi:hypothetical protein
LRHATGLDCKAGPVGEVRGYEGSECDRSATSMVMTVRFRQQAGSYRLEIDRNHRSDAVPVGDVRGYEGSDAVGQ